MGVCTCQTDCTAVISIFDRFILENKYHRARIPHEAFMNRVSQIAARGARSGSVMHHRGRAIEGR